MTQAPVTIALNFLPPPDNAKFVRVRGNRWLVSPRYAEWMDQIAGAWASLKLPMMTGWVVVEVEVYWPDARRRDAGNLFKALLDGLQHAGAIVDDCYALPQIVKINRAADCGFDDGSEGLIVTIREATDAECPLGRPEIKTPPRKIPRPASRSAPPFGAGPGSGPGRVVSVLHPIVRGQG